MNEPTDLPDGTVLDVVVTDASDDLDDDERAELNASIDDGLSDMRAGGGVDASDVLSRLRARR